MADERRLFLVEGKLTLDDKNYNNTLMNAEKKAKEFSKEGIKTTVDVDIDPAIAKIDEAKKDLRDWINEVSGQDDKGINLRNYADLRSRMETGIFKNINLNGLYADLDKEIKSKGLTKDAKELWDALIDKMRILSEMDPKLVQMMSGLKAPDQLIKLYQKILERSDALDKKEAEFEKHWNDITKFDASALAKRRIESASKNDHIVQKNATLDYVEKVFSMDTSGMKGDLDPTLKKVMASINVYRELISNINKVFGSLDNPKFSPGDNKGEVEGKFKRISTLMEVYNEMYSNIGDFASKFGMAKQKLVKAVKTEENLPSPQVYNRMISQLKDEWEKKYLTQSAKSVESKLAEFNQSLASQVSEKAERISKDMEAANAKAGVPIVSDEDVQLSEENAKKLEEIAKRVQELYKVYDDTHADGYAAKVGEEFAKFRENADAMGVQEDAFDKYITKYGEMKTTLNDLADEFQKAASSQAMQDGLGKVPIDEKQTQEVDAYIQKLQELGNEINSLSESAFQGGNGADKEALGIKFQEFKRLADQLEIQEDSFSKYIENYNKFKNELNAISDEITKDMPGNTQQGNAEPVDIPINKEKLSADAKEALDSAFNDETRAVGFDKNKLVEDVKNAVAAGLQQEASSDSVGQIPVHEQKETPALPLQGVTVDTEKITNDIKDAVKNGFSEEQTVLVKTEAITEQVTKAVSDGVAQANTNIQKPDAEVNTEKNIPPVDVPVKPVVPEDFGEQVTNGLGEQVAKIKVEPIVPDDFGEKVTEQLSNQIAKIKTEGTGGSDQTGGGGTKKGRKPSSRRKSDENEDSEQDNRDAAHKAIDAKINAVSEELKSKTKTTIQSVQKYYDSEEKLLRAVITSTEKIDNAVKTTYTSINYNSKDNKAYSSDIDKMNYAAFNKEQGAEYAKSLKGYISDFNTALSGAIDKEKIKDANDILSNIASLKQQIKDNGHIEFVDDKTLKDAEKLKSVMADMAMEKSDEVVSKFKTLFSYMTKIELGKTQGKTHQYEQNVEDIKKDLVSTIGEIKLLIGDDDNLWAKHLSNLKNAKASAQDYADAVKKARDAEKETVETPKQESADELSKRYKEQLYNLNDAERKLANAVDTNKSTDSIRNLQEKVDAIKQTIKEIEDSFNNIYGGDDKLSGMLGTVKQQTDSDISVVNKIQDASKSLDAFNEKQAKSILNSENIESGMKNAMESVKNNIESANKEYESLGENAGSVVETLNRSLSAKYDNFRDSFGKSIESALNSMVKVNEADLSDDGKTKLENYRALIEDIKTNISNLSGNPINILSQSELDETKAFVELLQQAQNLAKELNDKSEDATLKKAKALAGQYVAEARKQATAQGRIDQGKSGTNEYKDRAQVDAAKEAMKGLKAQIDEIVKMYPEVKEVVNSIMSVADQGYKMDMLYNPVKSSIKDATDALSEFVDKEILSVDKSEGAGKKLSSSMEEVSSKVKEAGKEYDKLGEKVDSNVEKLKNSLDTSLGKDAFSQSITDALKNNLKVGFDENLFEGSYKNKFTEYKNLVEEIGAAIQKWNGNPIDIITNSESDEMKEFVGLLQKANDIAKELNSKGANIVKPIKMDNLEKTFEQWVSQNSKANIVYGDAIEKIREQFKTYRTGTQMTQGDFEKLVSQIDEVQSAALRTGDTGLSFFDSLGNSLKGVARYLLTYVSVYKVIGYIKSGVNTVQELDTALIDLQKTSVMSNSELDRFYKTSNDVAQELGVSTKQVIEQASAWSRLG